MWTRLPIFGMGVRVDGTRSLTLVGRLIHARPITFPIVSYSATLHRELTSQFGTYLLIPLILAPNL